MKWAENQLKNSKKSFQIQVMWNLIFSNEVSEISLETEEQQDEVSTILIKLKEGGQAGDNASQFILMVAQFERLFGPFYSDECYKYSLQCIWKINHNYEILGNILKRWCNLVFPNWSQKLISWTDVFVSHSKWAQKILIKRNK